MSVKFDPIKDPDATLDYTLDWSAWLADGETISTVVWTVPASITEGATSQTGTTATIWLSGGTAGTAVAVGCLITTSAERTDERTMTLYIQQR